MTNNSNIDITISSDLDYENLIAEVLINGNFIGLVTNEPNKGVRFEIPEGQVALVNVELDTLLTAIEKAKAELLK